MSTDLDTSFDDVFARDQKAEATAETGPARDEQGRFAPKEAAPPPVESTPAPEAKAEPPPPAPEAQDTPPEGDERRIPLAELKAERAKRQSFEKQVEEIQRQNAELTRQMQEFMQRAQQPQQQLQRAQQQMLQEQMPDPWTDPQGALQWQEQKFSRLLAEAVQEFENRQLHMNANDSEWKARKEYGDQAVEAARQAALQAGLGEQFLMRRDPYGDLMKWHRSTSFLQKVGNDPEAYEKSIEQRAYERALADLRSGKVTPTAANGAPAPNTPAQRFPGSLASATATGAQGAVLTDEAIAASIFDSRRDRRA